ncbi:MAG: N-acetylneuraminate synthase family protein [Deltaproteobacteria bacterium]|nr:N-acetylneuraminate synthase family protein [Deltaproteobacteria bacterium]
MKEKIILVGGGGHCKSCIDVIEQEGRFAIAGIVDLPEKVDEKVIGCPVIEETYFVTSVPHYTFDLDSIDLLVRLGLVIFKIPSGEITNMPYLRKLGALRKRIIISTGMADLGEIEDALDILTDSGTPIENMSVLHCNTEYPTPFEDVNLKAMVTIGAAFPGIQVGYSDHTMGIEVPIAAVALGARVIEKHFTLDRNMEGPDHRASLEPVELKAMVSAIRNTEKAMGNGFKKPSSSELKNKPVARKSIVAAKPITKGEAFTEENLTVKRPGTGISPMRWDEVVGRRAGRDYEADAPILW